jgi:hypothetical protein
MRPLSITTPDPVLLSVRFIHGQRTSDFAVVTSSLTTAFMGSLLCPVVGAWPPSCAQAEMAKASKQAANDTVACRFFMMKDCHNI